MPISHESPAASVADATHTESETVNSVVCGPTMRASLVSRSGSAPSLRNCTVARADAWPGSTGPKSSRSVPDPPPRERVVTRSRGLGTLGFPMYAATSAMSCAVNRPRKGVICGMVFSAFATIDGLLAARPIPNKPGGSPAWQSTQLTLAPTSARYRGSSACHAAHPAPMR